MDRTKCYNVNTFYTFTLSTCISNMDIDEINTFRKRRRERERPKDIKRVY